MSVHLLRILHVCIRGTPMYTYIHLYQRYLRGTRTLKDLPEVRNVQIALKKYRLQYPGTGTNKNY